MERTSMIPVVDIERAGDAHRRFVAAVEPVDDAGMLQPTALPGWTVGHLLTHVARNADSNLRRAQAAASGEMIDQYPGGYEGRAREIEAGARRTARELIADVIESSERLEQAWREIPHDAWGALSRDVDGTIRPLHALPRSRWREVEVHLIDLGVGPTHRDWSTDFVDYWLAHLRPAMAGRLPVGSHLPQPLGLDARDELAWLYGRLQPPGLPTLEPWG